MQNYVQSRYQIPDRFKRTPIANTTAFVCAYWSQLNAIFFAQQTPNSLNS
jgi:hypothetical protein